MRKFKAGQTVWAVPIRYWERADVPHECSVLTDYEEGDNASSAANLYVHHNDYGHPVYLTSEKVYFTRETAVKAGKLMAAMMELKEDDYFDSWFDPFMKKTLAERAAKAQADEATKTA